MIECVIYDLTTGLVKRNMSLLDEQEATDNCAEGEAWAFGRGIVNASWVRGDGEVHLPPPAPHPSMTFDPVAWQWVPPQSHAADIAQAVRRINEAAGQTRLRFITDIPGQEMIYKAKLDEARAYLSGPEPESLDAFPLIAAEVGITAPDAFQIAMIWLWMAEIWVQAAAQIEAIRLQGTAGVQAAQSLDEIARIESRVLTALHSIGP